MRAAGRLPDLLAARRRALAARWQGRTRQSDARVTAYMALVTCSVTVLAMTGAAFYGVGFFFMPSTLLTVVAAVAGLVALLQSPKDAEGNRS